MSQPINGSNDSSRSLEALCSNLQNQVDGAELSRLEIESVVRDLRGPEVLVSSPAKSAFMSSVADARTSINSLQSLITGKRVEEYENPDQLQQAMSNVDKKITTLTQSLKTLTQENANNLNTMLAGAPSVRNTGSARQSGQPAYSASRPTYGAPYNLHDRYDSYSQEDRSYPEHWEYQGSQQGQGHGHGRGQGYNSYYGAR